MARGIRIGHDHAWASTPQLLFSSGSPTGLNLASVIHNPKNLTLAYAVSAGALPTGATFTGSAVTWPATGAAGTYPIRFTATYGARVVTSDPLLLRYLNVAWTPATTNTDGSAIGTILSHKIYAGQFSGNYTSITTVPWSGVASAQIALSASGTWFVMVTTVTAIGESVASAESSRSANVS